MPEMHLYPGVYIEEESNGVRTITGVATSITAFIGRALRGPENEPTRVQNMAEFERQFGELWRDSTLGYAVQQYFQNGGCVALIVRVQNRGIAATLTLPVGLNLVAASAGDWGGALRVRIDYNSRTPTDTTLFNLTIRDTTTGVTERFINLSTVLENARFITKILAQQSQLVRISGRVPTTRPTDNGDPKPGIDPLLDDNASTAFNDDGDDGIAITDNQISLTSLQGPGHGLWALEKADMVNLLCIPPLTLDTGGDVNAQTRRAAAAYCQKRRAIYLVDPLSSWTEAAHLTGRNGLDSSSWGLSGNPDSALYFPHIKLPDPLQRNRLAEFAPCGAVAGVIASIDGTRGVWKGPAGTNAVLKGEVGLSIKLTDDENDLLNSMAVNCLRAFPSTGPVVWGARTLKGADHLAPEWKYLPVRRLALFIEESLFRGTQWVVFEPNNESLHARIRLILGIFMHDLFRQGAFQGSRPRDAYFLKCDGETTTQSDIDKGIINFIVGFAPLKPAEFVVVKIQQVVDKD